MLLSAGIPAINTVGAPTFQGVVTGIHGCGVNTPDAADVAAATVGFANDKHIPNGMIFFIGTKSMILAAGCEPDNTRFSGVTIKVEGATPNVHIKVAPLTT